MATIAAIAFKRGTAAERLHKSLNILADDFGLERVTLPTQGRDAALIHANQLDVMANFMEQLVFALSANPTPQETEAVAEGAVTPAEPDAPDYDALSIKDLTALMDERGMAQPTTGSGATGNVIKADLVAALAAWDAEHKDRG